VIDDHPPTKDEVIKAVCKLKGKAKIWGTWNKIHTVSGRTVKARRVLIRSDLMYLAMSIEGFLGGPMHYVNT